MPNRIKVAVWDACVVIDAIQKTPGRYEMIEPFLIDAEKSEFRIVLSEGTVGEVSYLSGLDGKLTRAQQRELILRWLDNPFITRRAVHPGVSRLASEIGEKHNIKRLGDRLVIATALMDKIPLIHTFDGCGDSTPGLTAFDNQIGSPPIRITVPNHPEGALFASGPEPKP